MEVCAIILAGGFGKRLAPLSTREKPKQFHDLTASGKTLIQQTLARAEQFSALENIHIIGNKIHQQHFVEQSPKHLANLILEPVAKNTAASIFLAAQNNPTSMLVIMPADHYIEGDFAADIARAIKIAKTGRIVTFGIQPTAPNVNYGYIVTHLFTEKPARARAEKLIAQNARWNSGIFVARADVILADFRKFHPEFFKMPFSALPELPFDIAIMEKTSRHVCLAANFAWDDLGTWESVARHNPNLALQNVA